MVQSRRNLWVDRFRSARAEWVHGGSPSEPHVVLTKKEGQGNHSNTYFNCDLVAENPALLEMATIDLLFALERVGLSALNVQKTVAPAMGAITLAHELARAIACAFPDHQCLTAYAEKTGEGTTRFFRRSSIGASERCLLVEDTITTGTSALETAKAVMRDGGLVLPYIATLVRRSHQSRIDGYKIVSLITAGPEVEEWPPDSCPLCESGSEPVPAPKDRKSWERLMARSRSIQERW